MIIVKCQSCNFENPLEVKDLTTTKCRKCGAALDFKDAESVKYPEGASTEGGKYYYVESNLPKTN